MNAATEGRSVPLSRNRNYQLLWISQVLSGLGVSAAVIAFPLLVLALTSSAVASGVVLGAIATAQLLAGLPAGALVDRWDRKTIMLCCEAVQVIAAVSLVAALWWDVAQVAHLVAVAVVMGVCAALFRPAEESCLPRVVPAEQLSTAVALNAARASVAQLSGTAAGGFLFAIARFVPFLADALAHAVACVLLVFLRVPPREARPEPTRQLGKEITTGLLWVWGQRHIRVTALCAVVLNLFFSAFYLIVIVLAEGRGVPPGQIGIMAAMLGVGGLLGALAASRLSQVLSPYVSIIAVFWVLAALTPVAAFVDNGYLRGLLFAVMALLPATANTTIITRQLLLTPDDLRGRLSSVLAIATGVAASLGPMLGGLLATAVSGSQAVLVCAGGIAAVAASATLSPTLRSFPPAASDRGVSGGRTRARGRTAPQFLIRFSPMFPRKEIKSMDDDARYEVLRNDEEQYSLWLVGLDVPAGWYRVGKEGSKEECSTYVDEVWTDMRPRSLREQMDRTQYRTQS